MTRVFNARRNLLQSALQVLAADLGQQPPQVVEERTARLDAAARTLVSALASYATEQAPLKVSDPDSTVVHISDGDSGTGGDRTA